MKLFLLFTFLSLPVLAADISTDFERFYAEGSLSGDQVATLKNVEVVLIPGIMSETFISDDPRSHIELSFFTKDYFGNHLGYLKSLGIPARRLNASSRSVLETKTEIADLMNEGTRPVLFLTHSLGGMALLDYLLENQDKWSRVAGIIFMQSPFTGAPIASVVRRYPGLAKVFPLVNTSTEVVHYLSNENRKDFVTKNADQIKALTKSVRIFTVGAVANGYRSVFSSSVSIIRHGCVKRVYGKCRGSLIYQGPYDDSDGMVPFQGSLLPDTDYVKLPAVDHGETVLNTPFRSINHRRMTSAFLKLII